MQKVNGIVVVVSDVFYLKDFPTPSSQKPSTNGWMCADPSEHEICLPVLPTFRNAKCQNASVNGCGGFGNNWLPMHKTNILSGCPIYSAIIVTFARVWRWSASNSSLTMRSLPELLSSFKGLPLISHHRGLTLRADLSMNCPSEPGYYTFRKQFCFNDWHWLDNNG